MKLRQSIWETLQEPHSSRRPSKRIAFPLINKLRQTKLQQNSASSIDSQKNKNKGEDEEGVFTAKLNGLPGLNIIEYNLFRSNLQYKGRRSPEALNSTRKRNQSVRIVQNSSHKLEKVHLQTDPDLQNPLQIKIGSIALEPKRKYISPVVSHKRRQSIEPKNDKIIKSERAFISSEFASLKIKPLVEAEQIQTIRKTETEEKKISYKIQLQKQHKRKRLQQILEMLDGQFAPWKNDEEETSQN